MNLPFFRSREKPLRMVWRVEKDGRRSYLVGTAHFFPYSFVGSLTRLLQKVGTVMFEGPLDEESTARIAEDIVRYLCMVNALLAESPPDLCNHAFARLLAQTAEEMEGLGFRLDEVQAELEAQSLERLRRVLSFESIHEDLQIIESSARAILNIKEDLIGPARQRTDEVVHLPGLLEEAIASMGIPEEIVRTLFAPDLLPVQADPSQLSRVFINLVKNALEAMEGMEDKKLFVWARRADQPGYVVVDVIDSGVGISPEDVDKIWMAFYTTKGDRGGTGLGLPACAQIVGQLNGKITLDSEVGLGTTFSVFLPVEEVTDV